MDFRFLSIRSRIMVRFQEYRVPLNTASSWIPRDNVINLLPSPLAFSPTPLPTLFLFSPSLPLPRFSQLPSFFFSKLVSNGMQIYSWNCYGNVSRSAWNWQHKLQMFVLKTIKSIFRYVEEEKRGRRRKEGMEKKGGQREREKEEKEGEKGSAVSCDAAVITTS